METWNTMETWRHGHGDMKTWTWRHEDMDMETWRHGHGDIDMDMEKRTWRHGKKKIEAQAIFLNPFTICSWYKRKFVTCPGVDEETKINYLLANGLNILNGLAHLCPAQKPHYTAGAFKAILRMSCGGWLAQHQKMSYYFSLTLIPLGYKVNIFPLDCVAGYVPQPPTHPRLHAQRQPISSYTLNLGSSDVLRHDFLHRHHRKVLKT